MHVRLLSFVTCFALAALLLLTPFAQATTRLVLTLDELVTRSSLVFVGTVDAISVNTDEGIVYSHVTFTVERIVESVVEADIEGDTIELRFLGGNTAGALTEVAGQFIPSPGMRGLWFVDDTTRELVNPLTGWSQGYFPLVAGSDGAQWLNLREHPDYGVLAPPDPLAAKMRAMNFPDAQIDARFPQALEYPLDDFVDVIRAIANGEAQ
jgi:hypothetical protein